MMQCTGIKPWATHQREGKQWNLTKMSYDLCHIDRPRTAGIHQFSNSSKTEENKDELRLIDIDIDIILVYFTTRSDRSRYLE